MATTTRATAAAAAGRGQPSPDRTCMYVINLFFFVLYAETMENGCKKKRQQHIKHIYSWPAAAKAELMKPTRSSDTIRA